MKVSTEAVDELVYIKLYCEQSSQNKTLCAILHTLRDLEVWREVACWFYVRYTDRQELVDRGETASATDGHHLRLRFGFRAADVRSQTESLMSVVTRFGVASVEPYEPEVIRYGGIVGIQMCHELFWADSEFTLALFPVERTIGGILYLASAHELLIGLGLSLAERAEVYERQARWVGRCLDHGLTGPTWLHESATEKLERVGSRLVAAKWQLTQLPLHAYSARRLRAIGDTIRAATQRGDVDVDFLDLVTAFQHMHFNRVGLSGSREFSAIALLRSANSTLLGEY